VFSLFDLGPAPLGDLVGDQHDQLGAARVPLAPTGQQRRVGIGEVALEGLGAAFFFGLAIQRAALKRNLVWKGGEVP
jgi:hypothetical protein